jgi:hypothetical protein
MIGDQNQSPIPVIISKSWNIRNNIDMFLIFFVGVPLIALYMGLNVYYVSGNKFTVLIVFISFISLEIIVLKSTFAEWLPSEIHVHDTYIIRYFLRVRSIRINYKSIRLIELTLKNECPQEPISHEKEMISNETLNVADITEYIRSYSIQSDSRKIEIFNGYGWTDTDLQILWFPILTIVRNNVDISLDPNFRCLLAVLHRKEWNLSDNSGNCRIP